LPKALTGVAMRLQGRIETWNDQRGFGFVVQNGTGTKAFIHISALVDRGRRPAVGALVTYAMGTDERGRRKAVDVRFVERKSVREPRAGRSLRSLLVGALTACVIVAVAYVRLSNPNSTVEASVNKLVSHRESLHEHPEFSCTPKKTYCSEMTSCEEAYFHQERCGGTEMDGDHDGIPCERQWCQ
jgi:cold shock CspA family protein